MKKNQKIEIGGDVPTNGADSIIDFQRPYRISVTIRGSTDLLLNGWNCEYVEEKSKAAKGSEAKKIVDLEKLVYRDESNYLSLPSEYLRMAIVNAARNKTDPRSPRKSAMDLYKAAFVPLTKYASLGKEKWDYEDKRRVNVQKNSITRTRPAFKEGWEATFLFEILIPEYVRASDFHEMIDIAGRTVGVGDFRPTYGRFKIINFTVMD